MRWITLDKVELDRLEARNKDLTSALNALQEDDNYCIVSDYNDTVLSPRLRVIGKREAVDIIQNFAKDEAYAKHQERFRRMSTEITNLRNERDDISSIITQQKLRVEELSKENRELKQLKTPWYRA